MKPNTLSKEEIVKLYRNAAGDLFDTGYFHLHQPLEPDEVVKEISKYDFGWTFYNHVDDEQGYTDLNAKFTTGNKIASYLEAGLPFFYSTSFDFLHETMKKYNLDLPIKDLDEATKIGQMIKKINYNKLIKDVEKAREDYSMEKHFTRIEEFVENTIKNNKNKRLKKNIKNNSLNKSISQNYTTRTSCRLCNQPSELVLQFEPTPHGDAYLSKGREQDTKEKFPLDLMLCKDCEFIQLKHIVNPKILYRNYIYQSSDSLGHQKYFADYASSILANETNSKNKLAVDIGSNEGLLLSSLKEKGMRVLGVEPAKEIAERANAKGIKTINQFFNTETAEKIKQNHGQANIITANHVFANIDNIDNLIDGIKTLLSPNGTFIIETANLSDIINNNIFDNIYHEHLSYFSIKSLKLYLEKNGMELFNVTHSPIKGGSIRLSFQFKNSAKKPISQNVNNFLKPEEKSKLSNKETYKNFGNRINEEGKRINNILNKLSKNGEIAGFGAAVGSTTMIYQWHLEKHLRYLVDDNPSRHNLLSPGLQLPVLPPSTLNKKNPIATLILAWRYSDPIIKNNKSYIEDGGSFIIPFSESNINKTY
jgi:2-polyprenyl-3-methyl-5-hydroxy-6-metoxy-1,4-benzoquinol methylase